MTTTTTPNTRITPRTQADTLNSGILAVLSTLDITAEDFLFQSRGMTAAEGMRSAADSHAAMVLVAIDAAYGG